MSILIFIIILSLLVIVHEAGHFFMAKYFGIRVDEFGLGYPPKAKKLFTWRGTVFTLNWLPFGGFVKIFGENPSEDIDEKIEGPVAPGVRFTTKNRPIQAAVLLAGVTANFLFAWLLISAGFMSGLPAPVGVSLPVENAETVITTVIPGSPAAEAGLKSGDTLVSLSRGENIIEATPETASSFISESKEPITFNIRRGEENLSKTLVPKDGIVAEKLAVGIAMDNVGIVKLSPLKAVYHGLLTTVELTWLTAKALGTFIAQGIMGKGDLSQVTGPVGLVSMVGDVSQLGFVYLLSFTALISINLAIVNLIPFPALDGGRLLFVLVESIIRRPVPARVFNAANTLGFGILILLMLLITFRDVKNLL
ncbi:MAG: RIP metalloprotease RseP [bacterium]|nr:RIP metalloprotease RseP [bacterium]